MRRKWQRLRSLHARQWVVIAQSLVLVPAVQLGIRFAGFHRTAARLAGWSQREAAPRTRITPTDLADAVAIVAGRKMIGARCLGRSMVIWFLLRRRGVDAAYLIGAADPVGDELKAHAWVEVDGIGINEDEDVREQFGHFDLNLPRLTAPVAR